MRRRFTILFFIIAIGSALGCAMSDQRLGAALDAAGRETDGFVCDSAMANLAWQRAISLIRNGIAESISGGADEITADSGKVAIRRHSLQVAVIFCNYGRFPQ